MQAKHSLELERVMLFAGSQLSLGCYLRAEEAAVSLRRYELPEMSGSRDCGGRNDVAIRSGGSSAGRRFGRISESSEPQPAAPNAFGCSI